ncbi:MAG: lysophospholipid acyltransferase family protein [Pyrinomonadaceae bacterium]
MKHFRAIVRVVALCLATVGLYSLWLAGTPFVLLTADASRRWRGFNFRAWARAVARVAGMKIELLGVPPRGSFFLVSNHLGYMDIVALAACLDCVFVAKSEVARWPVIGFLCRSMNTVFIDRRRCRHLPTALARISRTLAAGSGVVLFAEGTSTSGANVAPFKPSLLELAARERMPVHYASLSYRTPRGEAPAHQSVCWWGDMTFLKHLFGLFQLSGFEAQLSFGAQPIEEEDRKLLAKKLWAAVNAQFVPVCDR